MRKVLAVACALAAFTQVARAEYVIGAGDVLQISVWQNESLERSVRVRQDGLVTYPPLGDLRAVGLTPEALASRIGEQLFAYTSGATQVTVTVTEFNSQYVVLNGAVGQPGRYAFEEIPSLLQVIGLAGGTQPGARLSEVRIVREVDGREEILIVDVNAYLETGDPAHLIALRPADIIYVDGSTIGPEAAIPNPTVPGSATIAVLGAIARPGNYAVEPSFHLTEILALAGGLSGNADLRKIKVISREPGGSEVVATIDLEEILEAGDPVRYPIRPGDALYIQPREPGLIGTVSNGVLSVLAVSRDILNFILIFDVLKNN